MITRVARTILKELNHSNKEISILFVDDRQIRDLNYKYLKRDFPTNVIAFPMAQGEFSEVTPQLLGDVVISVETAMKEARESGLSLEEEISFLLVHGILHLVGYDDTRGSRKQMEGVQEGLFNRLRLVQGRKTEDSPSRT